jgi:4-aminobutyrate aminotransferase-like enzyme
MKSALARMATEFELIGDIRGWGVLLGIELVTDRERKTPANDAAKAIAQFCLERGLIFQLRGTRDLLNVIRLVPPMTATSDEIDRSMSILYDAFRMVLQETRHRGPRASRVGNSSALATVGTNARPDVPR